MVFLHFYEMLFFVDFEFTNGKPKSAGRKNIFLLIAQNQMLK